MPSHPPAKVGSSPLGDLVTPFIHTSGSTPDPSPSLLPTYSLMSPSPAVIRPQKWGIQNWRRESREVPRLSNLGGSRSTPHQPSCSARETGALEDKGTCILMGGERGWGKADEGHKGLTLLHTPPLAPRGCRSPKLLCPPSRGMRAVPAQVSLWARGAGQQARWSRQGTGWKCDEPSAGAQPPVPGQELPISRGLESLPMLG